MPSNHLISVTPFSSCPQSFPASRSFPVSRHFASDGQSIRASASASVHSMNIQGWFPLELTGWISLQSKGLSRAFSNTTVQNHQFFSAQPLWSNSHIHTWLLKKNTDLTIHTFVSKLMSLLFNTLSRFVIAFLLRSKCLSISWLQSPSTVILEPKKKRSVTVSTFSPSVYHEVMGPDAVIFIFWMLSFKTAFRFALSPSPRDCLVPVRFLPLKWYGLHIWGWCFSQQSWCQLVSLPV